MTTRVVVADEETGDADRVQDGVNVREIMANVNWIKEKTELEEYDDTKGAEIGDIFKKRMKSNQRGRRREWGKRGRSIIGRRRLWWWRGKACW